RSRKQQRRQLGSFGGVALVLFKAGNRDTYLSPVDAGGTDLDEVRRRRHRRCFEGFGQRVCNFMKAFHEADIEVRAVDAVSVFLESYLLQAADAALLAVVHPY